MIVSVDSNGLIATTVRIPIPFEVQDTASILQPALARCPDAEALIGRHDRYTFRQLDQAINKAVHAFLDAGLKAGERVGMSLRNDPALVVAFLACQRLGLIWVGIGRHLAPREKLVIIDDAEVSLYLGTHDDIGRIRERLAGRSGPVMIAVAPGEDCEWSRRLAATEDRGKPNYPSIDPWAPAALAYTSGTTGTPKGAVISQHAMISVVASPISFGRGHQWDPDVRRGVTLPLTTLNIMIQGPFLAMLGGTATICMDRPDAIGVSEWISSEGVESISAAPATILDLLTDPAIPPERLNSIKSIVAGGGDVPQRLRDLYRARFGTALSVGYGLTEAPATLTSMLGTAPEIPGSSGTPHEHLEIGILGENGEELPIGAHGEVCARARREGPWAHTYSLMLGYWRRPESTLATIGDGWLHTGDIGSIDESGNLHIHARRKEVIIRGGSNVYPAEVEQIIGADQAVAACAVVGRPDERLGEVVVAVVQPKDPSIDATLLRERLAGLCSTELAKYKVPVDWIFVERMPRNGMNKILKTELLHLV